MKKWQLQDAKAHFSELVKRANTEGPQDVTVRGESKVVVLSRADYNKLLKPKNSFVEFMRNSPLVGVKIKIERDKSTTTRDIDL
jgi:antitoxin Phd